jgi:NAD(P)-dependent dehydrogenase (short-subunit alcohol dehydrogenase family)
MNALSMTKEKFGKLDVAVNCAGKLKHICQNFS